MALKAFQDILVEALEEAALLTVIAIFRRIKHGFCATFSFSKGDRNAKDAGDSSEDAGLRA